MGGNLAGWEVLFLGHVVACLDPFAGGFDGGAFQVERTACADKFDDVILGLFLKRGGDFFERLDFLALQLAKDTTGRPLWDAYVAGFSLAIGGMRVALAAGVPAGKALLIDPAFCGLLAAADTRVTLGYTGTQFTQNLVTIRGETQIIPIFTDYQAAMLVMPSAT